MLDALMVLGGFQTKRKFAQRLGIKDNTLGNWYKRNTFDIAVVAKAFPEVSPDWLITGEGAILREDVRGLMEEVARLRKQLESLTR